MFRITGRQGQPEFVQFGGGQIGRRQTGDGFMEATRLPVFDVSVIAQKASPFSVVVQNERAKELYAAGFFRPDMADQALLCLGMMSFEGIEEIKNKIYQNSTLFKMQHQIAPLMLNMAAKLDAMGGTQYLPGVQAMLAQTMGMQMQPGIPAQQAQAGGAEPMANSLGDALNGARRSTAGEARKQAAEYSTPR